MVTATRDMPGYVRVSGEVLRGLVTDILVRLDVPAEEAAIVADVLVTADLRGVESHGVGRLHTYYLNRLRRGLIRAKAEIDVVCKTAALAILDAKNSLGQVAGVRGMEMCISMAEATGAAAVMVRNSNHYGIAGYYAMMALPHDMIGISLTNSQPLAIPTYGSKRMIGTNAISLAAPAGEERPFVLDMATSVVPIGRIEVYARRREKVPPHWGADDSGHPTDEPQRILQGGGVFPLGGPAETSGYKGYGLATVVDILCGVLSGAGFLTHVFPPNDPLQRPSNVGHFFMAIKVEAAMARQEFKNRMDQLIRELKSSPKARGHDRIYIAGEKEFEAQNERRRLGIPISTVILQELQTTCQELGVPWPHRLL